MDFSTLITTVLHGLTLGMVLMLVAGGLTIIFGMLEVLNFAHGSYSSNDLSGCRPSKTPSLGPNPN